jgi:hypothetical protein
VGGKGTLKSARNCARNWFLNRVFAIKNPAYQGFESPWGCEQWALLENAEEPLSIPTDSQAQAASPFRSPVLPLKKNNGTGVFLSNMD